MLVLMRNEGERIVISTSDGLIVVMLVRVEGSHRAKIGVDAPKSVPVHREEVWEQVRAREQ